MDQSVKRLNSAQHQASVKGAAKGELNSAYTFLTPELRQASVKGEFNTEHFVSFDLPYTLYKCPLLPALIFFLS